MDSKLAQKLVTGTLVISAVICLSASGSDGGSAANLNIYLPREVVVENENLDLGSVGIIRGDKDLTKRAGSVCLGKFSIAGQEMVIDQATILSCLASQGIDPAHVSLSGSKIVTVRRNEALIASEAILTKATEFLTKELHDPSISRLQSITSPEDVVLDKNAGPARIEVRLSKYSTPDRPRVWAYVYQGDHEEYQKELSFSPRYKSCRAVALVDIAPGTILSSENTLVETMETTRDTAKWISPLGSIANRPIRKGMTISDSVVGPAQAPVVIKRRQTVMIRLETAMLYVSSFGEALEDGKVGQFIRVKVGDVRESRTVVGKVSPDGSVSPVF
jgi:flagella basal body P-ring formation protein FlgA